MNPFLDNLATRLTERFGDSLGRQVVIFPNRRSAVFFKHFLKDKLPGSAWFPEMYTINSLMEELSGLGYADPIDLNFGLYRLYTGLVKNPEPYDEFYYWGEMMISDFNDMDKYLVNAGDLFQNITDLKEIENVFDYLSPEQKELIQRFWSHFREKDLSPEQRSFLNIWKILYPLYTGLRSNLREKGMGYEGMIYREVADMISRGDYPVIKGENVIICGFNALSSAERLLFGYLRDSGRALFYWDYDRQYVDQANAEAGRFIRKNILDFPPDPGFPGEFSNLGKKKQFRVFNLPSDVLQTKKLYDLLSERAFPGNEEFSDTAIVLGDEDLLQPVLSSLPAEIPGLNITMGYPLKNTPVFSFVENLLRLQRNMSGGRERKSGSFYFRDVLSVINHQYVRAIAEEEAGMLAAEINRKNMIYISPSFFGKHDVFAMIFRRAGDAPAIIEYISGILDWMVSRSSEADEEKHWFTIEREFIFHIKTRLNKLQDIFSNDPVDTGIDTFTRLFRKIMNSTRIPFEGEPLQGLQLMGILETRLLDFKNVIFLSLNEGVMPASSTSMSYIPANLRYAFGMPTREDKDAIYAYYFYRLIQRADHVDIMYNSKAEGVTTGEPGRYIYQLKYLFDHDIRFETVSFRIGEKKAEPIIIDKTADVMARLDQYTSSGEKKLAPTSLSTWLDCPLRFYFTNIAGIREEDEAAEEIDASGFGTLLHRTMELLYRPFTGNILGQADFEELSAAGNIKHCLDQAFRDEFMKTNDKAADVVPEGRNIIVYEVIRRMVKAILDYDKQRLPFRILALEERVNYLFRPPGMDREIRIGGIIDRLDEKDGVVSIVDYKTGRVDKIFPSVEMLFDRDNWPSGKKLKAIFQTFVYAWVYSCQSGGKAVKPVLYVAGEIFNEDYSPQIVLKEGKAKGLPIEDFGEYAGDFESFLGRLLLRIFDPGEAFTQTDDEKRCGYCPYSGICHRPVKNW